MTPRQDPPRRSPIPYILGWVLLVPYAAVTALIAFADPRGGHGDYRTGYIAGVILAAVGLPAVILLVATLRRSVAALGIAGTVAMLSVCGTAGAAAKHYADRRAKIAEMSARVEELRKRTATARGTAAERAQEVDRLVADIEHTADDVGDHEADGLRCAARTIRDVAAPGRVFDAKVDEMGALGLLDAAKIQTRDDLEKRLRLIAEAEAANDAVEAQVRDMAPGFERCMQSHDAPEAMTRGAADVMRHDPRIANLLAFRAVERRVLGAMRAMLTLLDEEWGRWRLSGDKLQIDRPQQVERYKQIKQTLDAATREEAEIQRKIAGAAPT